MDRSQGESPLSNLTEFLPEKKHHIFTRKADAAGTIITESITLFTGFSDGQYHRNRELRAPSPIIPERMLDIWKSVNQPYIVISTMEHVYIYYRIGGNALVEESIAQQWFHEWLEPREHVRVGYGGWIPIAALPERAFKHAPTPKLRMKVLKRDGFRCRLSSSKCPV